MVSTVTLSPPQPLSHTDERWLTTFFNNDLNIAALAREEAVDPLRLLEWAERPEIKAQIRLMRRYRKLAVDAAKDTARLIAIETLKDVASSSKDPIERRRAATTLLRKHDDRPRRRQSHPPRPEGERSLPGAPRAQASKPLEHGKESSRPGGPTTSHSADHGTAPPPQDTSPRHLINPRAQKPEGLTSEMNHHRGTPAANSS